MAGSNGFGTLAQLRALKRLEKTYTDWPVMKIRVQALTDDEIVRCTEYARRMAPDDENLRYLHDRNAQIAFGMVHPPVYELAATDLDAAVAELVHIPPGVKTTLAGEILGLTYRKASDAYRDFESAAGSDAAEADTVASSSNSANSSA
jgi:hypothetical protein